VAEKSAKKKTKKTAKEASVLGALSSTRPTRLGGERRGTTTRRATTAAATKQSAASRPKAATEATATKPKAVKPKKPKAVPQPPRTEAPPAGWQVPSDEDGRRDGGPTELVTTAVQAVGELAQIGLTVGGQLLRRAAGRIPGR
jgi:hypothetical protein